MQETKESEVKFKCVPCGACCHNIKNALTAVGVHPGLDKAIKDFPFKLDDGKCPKLKKNRCSIYKDRPLLCRIDDIYTEYPDLAESREAWHLINHKKCDVMKQSLEDGKFVAFQNAMAYVGAPLDNQLARMTVDVYELTRKKSTRISFEELDKIVERHFPKIEPLTYTFVPKVERCMSYSEFRDQLSTVKEGPLPSDVDKAYKDYIDSYTGNQKTE